MYSTETERKKASLGVWRRERALWGAGGRLFTAINLIFKTCIIQSNNAILIIHVLVLDLVVGIKAKHRKQLGWLLG